MRDVAVLGVGMHRFGAYYGEKPNTEMALAAGMAAMRDAGLTFPDMQAAYVGHIFATVMSGVRVMKEFGLTGLPIQRIENASATGSAAFREACLASTR
jgi:acetyl-CoA acetyltransferase